MNKLQEAIAKLEAETDRNELNEKLLQMLQEKERELGDNLSEEEAEQAVSQVIKEHFMLALRRSFPVKMIVRSPILGMTRWKIIWMLFAESSTTWIFTIVSMYIKKVCMRVNLG